jgi:peptidoglycan/LPS O-acetylase OafA/YrhL
MALLNEPPASRSATIPALDGIRALAVLLVFFAHGGLEDVVPGGLGVTIFFVLSGYLISTLMRVEHSRSGRVDFPRFYLRRLLRLMPPLLIVVAVAGLLAAWALIDRGFTLAGLLAALLYFGNYHVIANDFRGMPAGLGVVWSLAIEEHFYLFYPPLAAWLLRVRRVGLSAGVLALMCALVLAWRCWLVSRGASADYVTMATDTRVDAILVGCLMALWRNPWLDPLPTASPRRDGAVVALSLAVLLATFVYRDETFRLTARYTLQSLAIAALIFTAVARAEHWSFRWLNAPPLVYIGSISYTIYLSHHVILLGLAKHWPQMSQPVLMLSGAALTLAVAEPMRRWVERPFALLRQRLHRPAAPHNSVPAALRASAP